MKQIRGVDACAMRAGVPLFEQGLHAHQIIVDPCLRISADDVRECMTDGAQ